MRTSPAPAKAHGAPAGPGDDVAPSRVVATAGHVDHGKSTLVEWLTGTNPDRLEEERRRGLTIDLGFASAIFGDIEVGFVDVPGHVRYLKNMLAGVGSVDACMFVVAATEGWKPQTEDHLRILDLMGIGRGVVALTHAALVDADRLEEVGEQIEARVAGTAFAGAPVVPVDVPAAMGTDGPDGLRAALTHMVSTLPGAVDGDRPRLWVDRSFAIRGAGAVLTGTLTGGTVSVGDRMVVDRGRHEPVEVRVRGLETYGRPVRSAGPGRRLAVNVSGVDHHAVTRGTVLVRTGQWHRCATADVALRVLGSVEHPVSHRGAYLAYVGTNEQAVGLRVIGGPSIEPGAEGFVRLRFTTPLPLVPGDRMVVREAGRGELVGGGELLDVAPVRPLSRAAPSRDPARVVAERGWVEAQELERLTGVPARPTLGRWVVDPGAVAATRRAVLELVSAAGPSGLDVSGLDDRARAVAGTLRELSVTHGIARLQPIPGQGEDPAAGPGSGTAVDGDLAGHPYLEALRASPFTPPPPDGVDRNDLRRLVRSGLVVESGGVWFAASALAEAAARIAELLARSPDGVRVSDVRDELGASRRYVLPLLAHFDGSGVTRRRGELRVAGPQLARLASAATPGGDDPGPPNH